MEGKLIRKLQQNKAFTLIEMLIVVGIMVILMGISMLGLYQFTVSLKMTELDNYAKSIYLEAQNRLIAEKVEGGMPKMAMEFETNHRDKVLPSIPQDYPADAVGEAWKSIYYVSKADAVSDVLISHESYIYKEAGDYIIEFNPQTGEVYGVFYWEEETPLNYTNDIVSLESREKEDRTDARIGYYGGVSSETLAGSFSLDQKVEIVNDEELYLKITYPATARLLANFDSSLTITYEIKDEHDHTWTGAVCPSEMVASLISEQQISATSMFETSDNVDIVYAGRNLEFYILLDSMENGFALSDIAMPVDAEGSKSACELVLDDELTIFVTSEYNHGADYCIEPAENVSWNFSGLYANKYVNVKADNSEEMVVEVSKVRHMRNLDLLNPSTHDMRISITDEIDFFDDNYVWAFERDENGVLTGVNVEDGTVNASRPINTFEPIRNDAVFVNSAKKVVVDGNNTENTKNSAFRNFVIKAASGTEGVGIWSKTNNVSFENIIIEDILVDADGCSKVGTLVGEMAKGELVNCGVYLTTFYSASGIRTYYNQNSSIEASIDAYYQKYYQNGEVLDYSQMTDVEKRITDYSQIVDIETLRNVVLNNEMELRYDLYKINGANRVGGLVGHLLNTNVSESYAAIKVEASGNHVGGFVGSATNNDVQNEAEVAHSILSSYASGDVIGNAYVGGFVGTAENMNIGSYTVTTENGEDIKTLFGVYATGTVYASEYFGGFVGNSTDTSYKECTAYGAVRVQNGEKTPKQVNGGGFIGNNAGGNSFDKANGTCTYLAQTDHNDSVITTDGVISKNYKDYLSDSANDLAGGTSYPYDVALLNKAFPFAEHWAEQPHHYGNWPAQYVINSSLVYYEKYEDNTYGFYCQTYISGSSTEWILDTLKDEVVIDDGYAILTKYNLMSVNYDLQIGSLTASEIAADPGNLSKYQLSGKLSNTDGSLVRLNQQGTITFEAYDDTTGEVTNSFTVTGMYLYQLPYELQCTDRYGVENFYDRLTLNDGVIYDGDEIEENNVVVIDGLTFFYCPHFAKTAYNANVNSAEELAKLPTLKIENPEEVIVRSARQLNALGRFPYYWNERGGGSPVRYEQEVDIDFGKYTWEYCGRPFNLLEFDKEYSNQPIGQVSTSTYGSFMNDYDGNCYKIIDYCVKSDRQYVGLFGEIYKGTGAERTQIQNVVMVVSNKENIDANANINPLLLKNAGYIIGTFQDDSGESNGNRKRTGVGALVGFEYNIGKTIQSGVTDDTKIYTISNCAVAGYKVEYHLNPVSGSVKQPLGIVVGGFAGYARSNISNCSATNDVNLVVNADYTGDNAAVFLGGFVGSYYYGTIRNCYSGGTIDVDVVDDAGTTHYVNRLRIGGFCPGWLDAPGITRPDDNSAYVRYLHVYSYAEVDYDVRYVREASNSNKTFVYLIPSVSRMQISYYRDWPWNPYKWHTESVSGANNGISVPGISYYLLPIYENYYNEVLTDEVKDYFEYVNGNNRKTCDPISYENLSNEQWIENPENQTGVIPDIHMVDSYRYTYPESSYLKGIKYPFPAVVTDANGNYVHYGDWPANSETITTNYPTYYEKYADGTFGYYYLKENGTVVNKLSTEDSDNIVETGYGYLTCAPTNEQKGTAPFSVSIQVNENGGTYQYYMVPTPLGATDGKSYAISGYNYGITSAVDGVVGESTDTPGVDLYINPSFAAAISLSANTLGSEDTPLQVRTQAQLLAVDDFADGITDVFIKQTHSVYLTNSYAPVSIRNTYTYDGGNEFAIRNATTTIFDTNNGVIKNTVVSQSNISINEIGETDTGYAFFVHTNNGYISESKVVDSDMTSAGSVAGFVYNNTGTIANAGVVARSSYEEITISGKNVYGFVANNTGTITASYAVGTMTAQIEAAGFVGANTGTITTSYANANVTASDAAAKAAGFAITANGVTKSYASGRVTANEVYGFMIEGNASQCYTICEMNGVTATGFAASNTGNNCYWGYDEKTGYNTSLIPDVENPPTGAVSLRQLMRNATAYFGVTDFAESISMDIPYTTILGDDYPYPSVGVVHYGDWKAPSVEGANNIIEEAELEEGTRKHVGIFYYERYMDGTYGIYAEGIEPYDNESSVLINTLADAGEPVISSGYGVFYHDSRNNRNWYVNNNNDITDYDENVLEDFFIPGLDEDYKFHYMNNDALQGSFSRTLSHGSTWTRVTIYLTKDEINSSRPGR